MIYYRNKMKFIEFQKRFKEYLVFSLLDIRKEYPNFPQLQLNRWKEQGYLINVRQSYYCLSDVELSRDLLLYIANRIYSPSYISLEIALSYYNLIPESVYHITSVSTKKTKNYYTQLGNFIYRHIKSSAYFGYKLIEFDQKHRFLLAEPEKALLDYFYLNSHIASKQDFGETRINSNEFDNHINLNKLNAYLVNFKNKSFEKRIKNFLEVIRHA